MVSVGAKHVLCTEFCVASLWQNLQIANISTHPSISKFLKDLFSHFQAVEKQRSPTPSQLQGWPMPSLQRAARAT